MGHAIATEPQRLGYRPGLDGLRGVAVLLVVAAHFQVSGFTGNGAGGIGVTVFFVLSGFLITVLLLEEQDRDGTISYSHFYMRRVRRLAPALVATVTVATALSLIIGYPGPWRDAFLSLFYVSNFARADGVWMPLLAHTWSLAVEEQFYLVWPLTMVVAGRHAGKVAGGLAVAALCYSIVLTDLNMLLNLPFTRGGSIFAGCAAGWLWHQGRLRGSQTGWLMLAGSLWLPWGWTGDAVTARLTVATVATMLLIVPVMNAGPVMRSRPLLWLGTRSYGLYLWHYPFVVAIESRAVALVMSLVVTELSWRLIETKVWTPPGQRTGADRVTACPTSQRSSPTTSQVRPP